MARWNRILDKLLHVRVVALLLAIAAVFVIQFGFNRIHSDAERTFDQFVADLYANGGAELLSIAVTVLIIDWLNERRAIKEERERLVLQMGSPIHDAAIEAVRQLRYRGWLLDGSLKGAAMGTGKLMRVGRSKLGDESRLGGSSLDELMGANLQDAYLYRANLEGVYLEEANLRGARLWQANLQGAYLTYSNLMDAKLRDANLRGADLQGAFLNANTILPDGKNWTHDTNMGRYTDPKHPDFWQPEWVKEKSGNRG
jgi:hypothetical protein